MGPNKARRADDRLDVLKDVYELCASTEYTAEDFRPTDWSGDLIAGLVRTEDGGRIGTAVIR